MRETEVEMVLQMAKEKYPDEGARTFDGVEKIEDSSQEEKILDLEQKLQTKNKVLSELMEEHLKLKKTSVKSK